MTSEQLVKLLPKDSWTRLWLDSWPTVEAPVSYLLLTGLSVLGGAIARKCWFQDDYRRLYPMLNLLLIGPSGIGKSSSIEIAQTLLANLPAELKPQFIIGSATPEKLHEDLVLCPHSILYASELANFFGRQKYMEGMIPYVTELLDCRPLERRTKSGQVQRIDDPEVTIIGGSTVEWLQDQLPDSAVGGGFLPRFCIVKESVRRQRVPNAEHALSKAQWLRVRSNRELAYCEFTRLVTLAEGPVQFADYGVSDAYATWYLAHVPASGHLAPFAARAPEFVKRMAMLLAISADRTGITEPDLEAAIGLYTYTEKKLQEVVVPKSQTGKLLTLVLQCINPQGSSSKQIFHAMKNFTTALDCQRLLDSLVSSGDVVVTEGKYIRQESH